MNATSTPSVAGTVFKSQSAELKIKSIMKKLILITSCVALFAATSFAQDTTRTRQRQSQSQQEPQQRQQSDQMRNEDMKNWTKVQTSEVPEQLRSTLNSSQYTGWESGTIYKDKDGDKYMLRTTGNNAKTYYFDKDGKQTTKPNRNGGPNLD